MYPIFYYHSPTPSVTIAHMYNVIVHLLFCDNKKRIVEVHTGTSRSATQSDLLLGDDPDALL